KGSRNQSQGFQWRWDLGDLNLNDQLGGLISDTVSNVLNDMLRGGGRSKFRGLDGRWVNDTNRAQLSHLETPSGEGFTVEDNNISAAHIAKLVLENSKFIGNSLQGGRIYDLVLSDSEISNNHLHGASITESELTHSTLNNVKLNGAAFDKLELRDSEIEGGEWNGANMKNVVLAGSRLIEIEINGGRFKDVTLEADTVVERLRLVGSSWRRCKLSNTTFQDVTMSRQDISDLVCESTVLTDVRFKSDWQKPAKGLTMRNFQANNVRFRDCQFDNTEFLDCAIDGLRFEGVDFSGMTLTSSIEFHEYEKQTRGNRSKTHE
ncbi:MAG: pentapeptide repeat-containing protein, partial [Gammaproteobacteria bacterium]|nr:pentapeptide repeat-containing protein [Gammaproteobacteria bacterium]